MSGRGVPETMGKGAQVRYDLGMKSRRLLVGTLLFWTLLTSTAQAGPWTREPGRWYFKLAQGLFVAEGFRDSNGTFISDTTYRGWNTSAYGEVGVVDGVQAQLYVPFTIGENDFDSDSILRLSTPCEGGRLALSTQRRTFGDALVGAQWSTPWLSLPHAVRVNAKLPLYSVGEPKGLCGDLFPQPGDGQVDLDLWLSAGDSIADGELYLYGELGHRFRTELYFGEDMGQAFADTFLAFGQIGWQLLEGSFLMLNLNYALPYEDDGITKGSLTLGPAFYLGVGDGFAVEAALDFTPWARNSAEGRSGSIYWTAATIGVSHKVD